MPYIMIDPNGVIHGAGETEALARAAAEYEPDARELLPASPDLLAMALADGRDTPWIIDDAGIAVTLGEMDAHLMASRGVV